MAYSQWNWNQISTFVNAVYKEATGQEASLGTLEPGNFAAISSKVLATGMNQIIPGISQVLSKTIFSYRPYSAKFVNNLLVDTLTFGNRVRKLRVIDKPVVEDDRRIKDDAGTAMVDGATVDQYKINKPQVLETNYYGMNTYEKSLTIFRDQIQDAFEGAAQLGSFLSMIMGNVTDQLTQCEEAAARAAVASFIAGKYKLAGSTFDDTTGVYKVLTLYNAESGQNLDADTVMEPANLPGFLKWLSAFIRIKKQRMAERSLLFHQNYTNAPLMCHTPIEMQKCYFYAPILEKMKSEVLADTFNPGQITLGESSVPITYWQNINADFDIKAKAAYPNAAGSAITVDTSATTVSKVLCLVFDPEAISITRGGDYVDVTPYNAAGHYSNTFWHKNVRFNMDFSENAFVCVLA